MYWGGGIHRIWGTLGQAYWGGGEIESWEYRDGCTGGNKDLGNIGLSYQET